MQQPNVIKEPMSRIKCFEDMYNDKGSENMYEKYTALNKNIKKGDAERIAITVQNIHLTKMRCFFKDSATLVKSTQSKSPKKDPINRRKL